MPERVEVEWGGAALTLLADRAVWWETERALLVADLHLGKAEHFRASGRAVPEGVTVRTLGRLGRLIERHGAERVIVLGDLMHAGVAREGPTATALRAWRGAHSGAEMVLVRGNHDRHAPHVASEVGFEDAGSMMERGGLALVHDPEDAPANRFALCGHLHPGVRIAMGMRASCFWFSEGVGVLPAFGEFTGLRMIEPGGGDRVFAVEAGSVAEVPVSVLGVRTRNPRRRAGRHVGG